MNNKKGGFGAKLLLVLILMIASAVGGAYGYNILDGKMASRDALKAVENVDISDYDTAEQSIIQGYIDDAKKNLETAKSRKDVYEIISDFVKNVEKVQTKAEKELEAALKAAEEAKQQYNNQNYQNNQNNQNNYNSDNSNSDNNYNDNNYNDSSNSSSTESNDNSGYKSNDLNTGTDETDEGNGLLNSLFGGLANGTNGD